MAKNGRQGEGGGKPKIVFTAEQIAQVEALSAVMSKQQISDYFGISSTTFREIEGRQPEVSDAYKKGKAKAIGAIGQSLVKQAREGNLGAQIFYLKTQAGWRETDADNGTREPITINIVKPDGAD
jgi:hypothetical protein